MPACTVSFFWLGSAPLACYLASLVVSLSCGLASGAIATERQAQIDSNYIKHVSVHQKHACCNRIYSNNTSEVFRWRQRNLAAVTRRKTVLPEPAPRRKEKQLIPCPLKPRKNVLLAVFPLGIPKQVPTRGHLQRPPLSASLNEEHVHPWAPLTLPQAHLEAMDPRRRTCDLPMPGQTQT